MTPERKEQIRQILSKERLPCKKCGYTYAHYRYDYDGYAQDNHDYIRPITIEDELLEALDAAEKELRSIYD